MPEHKTKEKEKKENKPPKSAKKPKRDRSASRKKTHDSNNNKIAHSSSEKNTDGQCKFTQFGCEFKGTDIAAHSDKEPIMHLSVMNDNLLSMKREVYRLVDDVNTFSDGYDKMWRANERIREVGTGAFIWRIEKWDDVFNLAAAGTVSVLHSPGFYSARHGYRLIASMCPYGDGKVRGQYVSVFVALVKGEFDNLLQWPFSYKVKIVLMDQEPLKEQRLNHAALLNVGKPTKDNQFLRKPVLERNPSFGLQKFADIKMLGTRKYTDGDQMYLKIELTEDENAMQILYE